MKNILFLWACFWVVVGTTYLMSLALQSGEYFVAISALLLNGWHFYVGVLILKDILKEE